MEYVRFSPLMKMIIGLRDLCPNAFARQPIRRPKPRIEEYKIYRLLKPISRLKIHELEEIFTLFKEPLSPEELRKIDKDVETLGTEALAWYRPFHHLPIELWGIYITLRGLKYLLSRIGFHVKALAYAFEILWQHELFHFLVELFSLRAEVMMLKPKYLPYETKIYRKQYPNCLEEALANRHVLSRRILKPVHRSIRMIFDKQPGWYRRYKDYLGPNFKHGKEELCNLVIFLSNRNLPIDEIRTPIGFSVRIVPTYIVSTRYVQEIPGVLSFVVKVNKVIRLLKRQGCKLVRQRGSHAIFDIKGRKIPIPVQGNQELHHKIVKQILEALGMTREEFLRRL